MLEILGMILFGITLINGELHSQLHSESEALELTGSKLSELIPVSVL